MDKEKLKVLFWRTEFYGAITEGGTASLHIGKIRGFQKLGHEVAYASSGPMILPDGVKLYRIPFSKFLRNFPEVLNLPYNNRSVREMKRIIEVEKPNFIYQHHHDFHWGGTKIKRDLGIPFILHVDGIEYWVKKNWGKLYFEKLLKWAEEIQLFNADSIIVPSDHLRDQLVEYGVEKSKIVSAPNGVEPDQFTPAIKGDFIRKHLGVEKKYVVGFTGTFGHWHGVEVLAHAVKDIVRMIPEAVVLFVGDGNLRPNIEAIVRADGVENNIIITGFLPFALIPNYLAACDVLLSPCVNNADSGFFNSPVKLFEYMAMGKPIVATNVGQQGVVIQHEINGLLCNEQSPEELAESVFRFYKDKDLAERLGKEARKQAVEKHDWSVNSQLIVDAYYRIIAKKALR